MKDIEKLEFETITTVFKKINLSFSIQKLLSTTS